MNLFCYVEVHVQLFFTAVWLLILLGNLSCQVPQLQVRPRVSAAEKVAIRGHRAGGTGHDSQAMIANVQTFYIFLTGG